MLVSPTCGIYDSPKHRHDKDLENILDLFKPAAPEALM